MAVYVGVRSLNRSQKIRIGTTQLDPDSTKYVDITNGKVKRDLQKHQAIGGIVLISGPTSSNSDIVVETGGLVTAQGTPDQTVAVSAGETKIRSTGATKAFAASPTLAATAAHATLARIDIVQVNATSGAVSYKQGTAAATPVAPSADTGNVAIATVARAATDNTISTGDITDVRPRP